MIKILEYQACGLPVVLYDLVEGRRSTEGAALFARRNDPIDFAEQVAILLDSESSRRRLGANGRKRIEDSLNWGVDKQVLWKAYETVLREAPIAEKGLVTVPVIDWQPRVRDRRK
jgi:glycosyltransferase involved in cell wall biosynthesis